MAITINHENMSDAELNFVITEYEETYQLPVTDVLKRGCEKLPDKLTFFFPDLSTAAKIKKSRAELEFLFAELQKY